jgi:hypothetical protein
MPLEKRTQAAAAFWRDDQGVEQQAEATALLARRLKFRTKSIQALAIDRRARFLAQVADVSDALASRALVAYHFENARPLMAAFLDALGIAHENGLITDEEVAAPESGKLAEAVAAVRHAFPAEDVDLYLRTLVALDSDTWTGLDALVPASA